MGIKISELDPTKSLGLLKVRTPTGVVGYWRSQWGYNIGKAGVWLSDGETDRIYPIFVNTLKETLDWEIADKEDKVNCHKKTDLKFTNLTNEGEWYKKNKVNNLKAVNEDTNNN